jgi:ATPase family associated with various cellular activities (AAA)/Winged helix domain, variant
MTEAEWLEANSQFLASAITWLRGLLKNRDGILKPAAPSEPVVSQFERRFWNFGRRAELPLPSPQQPQIAGAAPRDPAQERSGAAAPPALMILAQRLGLSEFERNLLLLCAAMDLDPSIANLYAQAQGDLTRPYPTFALAMTLFKDPSWDALSPERPLRRWRLIEISQPGATPLTVSALRADERIVNYLKGLTYLDDRLTPVVSPVSDPGGDVPNSQKDAAQAIAKQLSAIAPADAPPVVQLLGSDSPSKQIVTSLVCVALNLKPYRLDWSVLPTSPTELESLARLWQRESLLLRVALLIDTEAADGNHVGAVDHLLSRLHSTVFLATRNLWPRLARAPITAEIKKPTAAEQRACWAAALGNNATTAADALATQFNFNADTIRDIAQRELDNAAAGGESLADRLWDSCRALTRPRVDALAQRLAPVARWEDIVLPATELALLHRIADQVRSRGIVYRDWGFARRMSRGLGISVLLSGASGTGKTMAAEVLANELRLDLFRIDLSAVVSKYIGETEANLRRLFDAAEEGGAILFFDEADALFGKRTEVKDSHDRYANIEVNYLLQRMESYSGLAILATNMKGALDQAFLRRLRMVVDLPYPSSVERRAMWTKAFPPEAKIAKLDFDRLAKINVTGGNIAVIALNAAFEAAHAGTSVTMPIVLNAARIEFRKLGRPINESELRWQGAAA